MNRAAPGNVQATRSTDQIPPPPLPSGSGTVRLVMRDGTVRVVPDPGLHTRMKRLADQLLAPARASL